MKGKASDPTDVLLTRLMKELMPGTTYEFNSGGDPQAIPKLKYEDLKQFHRDFYHPSNATFLMYGDMDAEKVMKEIEENTLKFFQPNPVDTRVKLSKQLKKPEIVRIKVPADAVETDKDKPCKYIISYLCDPIDKDPFETFLMTVLSSALFDSQDSPMYKALLESRIANKYLAGTGYDYSLLQSSFTIGLNGVANDSEQLIESTINKTLEEVVSKGFNPLLIDSALHQIEIRTKEIKENYGLSLIASMIPFVLHTSDPLIPLHLNTYVDKLRQMLGNNQPVFQDLIKNKILANSHCVRIMAVPDSTFVDNLNEQEEHELQGIEKKMDKLTEETVLKEAEKLLEAQGKEENSDVLPTLLVEDIAKTVKYIEYESQYTISGVPVNYIIEPTNGITYVRVKSDIKDLPSDLKALFPVYKKLINSLGTQQHPYNEFDTLKDLYTVSGITSSILTPSLPTSLEQHQEVFIMKFAALDRNLPKAFEIFNDFVNNLRFDEFAHIQNLIKRSVKSRTEGLLDSGTSYGSEIASASLTPAGSCYESLKILQHDCSLLNSIQSSTQALENFKEKLQQIHNFVLNQQSLEFLVHTSETSNKQVINTHLESLISSVSAKNTTFLIPRQKLVTAPFTKTLIKSYFTLPIQVNYVAEAFLGTHYTAEDYPALKILTEIMSMKVLLKEVREKGGAYGASASVDSLRGTIVLSSFRDPNNLKTFSAFKNSITAMAQGQFTTRDIDEGKLGVFGRLDKPAAIYDKGLHQFFNRIY
jgi:presequence protease